MSTVGAKLLDFFVAYLVSIGLGILFIFTPILYPLFDLFRLIGKSDFVYALAVGAAIGNPIGLALSFRWQQMKVRRWGLMLLVTGISSTAGSVAFLHIGWLFYRTRIISNDVGVLLTCLAGVSILSCISWHICFRKDSRVSEK